MPGLSRRKLVVGALAAPLGAALSGTCATAVAGPLVDPVMMSAARWIAVHELAAAMEAEWQGLETRLFDRAARLKMDPLLACRSGLAEAKAMRALDRRIKAAFCNMQRVAGEARAMQAISMEGAVAKIELGLRVQGEFDWRENALELIEDGVGEVRRIASRRSGGPGEGDR